MTLSGEVEGLKKQLQSLLREKEEQRQQAARRLCELSAMWQSPKPGIFSKGEAADHTLVKRALLSSSHSEQQWQGCRSKCFPFQSLKILDISYLHNPHLWGQYKKCREDMREKHRACGVELQPVQPSFSSFDHLLPGLELDPRVNECILAHGCHTDIAPSILSDGWDIRYSNPRGRAMYGEGIYFAREPCKCHRYTSKSGPRQLLLGRVALGDPAYVRAEYAGRLPPSRDPSNHQKGRFDSVVVDPQLSERGQAHGEYVIFKGEQAYPQMLITYTIE